MNKVKIILILGLLPVCTTCFSQKLIVKRADKEYNSLRYASAAELYEQAVLDGAGNKEVYLKLADSYYKIKDTRNAEKYYEKASEGKLTDSDTYQFIQSLLQNGKTAEAVKLAINSTSTSVRIAKVASTNVNRILSDTLINTVHFLDFNTPYSDFSPTPYDKGLVFVSSRHRGKLHNNVFGWNNTPFLNLYYVDTTQLGKVLHEHAIKREQYTNRDQPHLYAYDSRLHADETRNTSNDTHTAGYYSIYFRENEEDTIYFKREAMPFSSSFNTRYHEGPLAFNAAQDQVVFTRNNYHKGKFKRSNKGVNHLKLFSARKTNSGWSSPIPLPFNSDEYSVGHPAFDAAGKYLYFASDMPNGKGGSDLYKVAYNQGQWGVPENLGSKINTDGNELFPFISDDILYFSSDGHGGLGGLDVIAVNLKNIEQQKNMGYPINTHKDDFGLIVSKSGKEGFVSSNRNRTGLDDDIYGFNRSRPIAFTRPIQVLVVDRITEKPIPSAQVRSDGSLLPCTTNEQGLCGYDVEPNNTYSFVGSKEKYLEGKASLAVLENQSDAVVKIYLDEFGNSLFCKVTDRGTAVPIADVKVTITDRTTNNVFSGQSTSALGELRTRLENIKVNDVLNYSFRFEHPGYLTKVSDFKYTITRPGEIPVHEFMDIQMDRIDLGMDIGKIIHINPIYFDLNKSIIRKDASVELDKIVQVMKDNPTMVIELGSHTDCRSSAQYNMALSDRRAKASAEYVVSKGIEKARIYGKGYGEAKLVNGCACEGPIKPTCSEAEHQLNRRTEFVIVKM